MRKLNKVSICERGGGTGCGTGRVTSYLYKFSFAGADVIQCSDPWQQEHPSIWAEAVGTSQLRQILTGVFTG